MAATTVPVMTNPSVLSYPYQLLPTCPTPVGGLNLCDPDPNVEAEANALKISIKLYQSTDKWNFNTGTIDNVGGESLFIPYVATVSGAANAAQYLRDWNLLTAGIDNSQGGNDLPGAYWYAARTIRQTDNTGAAKTFRHRDLNGPCGGPWEMSGVPLPDLSVGHQTGMLFQINVGTSSAPRWMLYLWKKVVDNVDPTPENFFFQTS